MLLPVFCNDFQSNWCVDDFQILTKPPSTEASCFVYMLGRLLQQSAVWFVAMSTHYKHLWACCLCLAHKAIQCMELIGTGIKRDRSFWRTVAIFWSSFQYKAIVFIQDYCCLILVWSFFFLVLAIMSTQMNDSSHVTVISCTARTEECHISDMCLHVQFNSIRSG